MKELSPLTLYRIFSELQIMFERATCTPVIFVIAPNILKPWEGCAHVIDLPPFNKGDNFCNIFFCFSAHQTPSEKGLF